MLKQSRLLSKIRGFTDEVFKVHFKGYDNVPSSREKSAVSPGTAQSGRQIQRKYRAVYAYHSVPPDSTTLPYNSIIQNIGCR